MLLSIKALSFRYGETPILQNLEAKIGARERVAVVGPNGCGKSTLIGLICGELEADHGSVERKKGARIVAMEQVAAPRPGETVRQYVSDGLAEWKTLNGAYQKALASLEAAPNDEAALRAFGEAESAFLVAGGHSFPARLDASLNHLGLRGLEAVEASALSGGQRHRCRLARLLLTPADLWILDEPTNHLDDDGIDWLIELLGGCKHAWLVVSHDRHLLETAPETIWELDHGRVERYHAPYSAFQIGRALRQQEMEAAVVAYREEAARLQAFVDKYKAGQKSKQASARAKALERLVAPPKPPSRQRKLPISFARVPRSADEVLIIDKLTVGYDQPLIEGVELRLRRGDRVVLKGQNGCGKSTLLRTITGAIEPLSGEVAFGVKVRCGMLSQQMDAVLGDQLAGEWLEAQVPSDRIQDARNLAGGLGLVRLSLQRPCDQLSGGERTRLALAALLLRDLNLLILDEPTNHLDLPLREALEEALVRHPGTLIVVSHDRAFAEAVATKWWRVRDRRLEQSLEAEPRAVEAPAAASAAPKGRLLREAGKAKARLSRRLAKAELAVENCQSEIASIKAQLADPGLRDDWEQLARLQESLHEQQAELELAELAWLETSEELDALDLPAP